MSDDGHHDDFGGLHRDLRSTGYEQSVRNQAQVTLATDNVFSDGSALELATVTGTVGSGLTAVLTVAI